jgi:hypothetical protein
MGIIQTFGFDKMLLNRRMSNFEVPAAPTKLLRFEFHYSIEPIAKPPKRPEGPAMNSPERELGVLVAIMTSAEGATQKQMRAFSKRLD